MNYKLNWREVSDKQMTIIDKAINAEIKEMERILRKQITKNQDDCPKCQNSKLQVTEFDTLECMFSNYQRRIEGNGNGNDGESYDGYGYEYGYG